MKGCSTGDEKGYDMGPLKINYIKCCVWRDVWVLFSLKVRVKSAIICKMNKGTNPQQADLLGTLSLALKTLK